jgi:hypothetical protein
MTESPPVSNPFALMMDPEAVLRAVAESPQLTSLRRRVCRPLDKPMRGQSDEELGDDGRSPQDDGRDISA